MLYTLLFIGAIIAIAALIFWWRRRNRPVIHPVDDTYVCPVCDETDCICRKQPDKETRSRP